MLCKCKLLLHSYKNVLLLDVNCTCPGFSTPEDNLISPFVLAALLGQVQLTFPLTSGLTNKYYYPQLTVKVIMSLI